jgi:acyl-CoA synthetase (AMP-forming)/AMP-acid ligase II
MFATLQRDLRFYAGLARTLGRVRGITPDSPRRICDDLEASVRRWPDREAIRFEGRSLSYREMDGLANRFARWALESGLRPGDRVALFLPNRMEYLPAWYGLSKVGVVSALVNNQLTGQALAHCLNLANAQEVIVDPETSPALQAVLGNLEKGPRLWSLEAPLPGEGDLTALLSGPGEGDLTALLSGLSDAPPPAASREGLTAHDTALLIYTSGTTGLPKAARVTHVRVQLYMRGFAGATGARPDDRIYVALPLYHATGGLCGMGAALLNGACVVLRRRFSATQFWSDILQEDCTLFAYIGELCRYLANRHGLQTLYPTDWRARADVERWMDWGQSLLAPSLHAGFWGLIRTAPADQDPAAIRASGEKTATVLGVVEATLANRPWLCGNELTLAEIALGMHVYRWLHLPWSRAGHTPVSLPRVTDWHARLAQRPAFRKVVMIDIV